MSIHEQRSAIAGAMAGLTVAGALMLGVLAMVYPRGGAPATQPTATTILVVTPDTTHQWVDCYQDPDTERWVPNLAVPAPGECP